MICFFVKVYWLIEMKIESNGGLREDLILLLKLGFEEKWIDWLPRNWMKRESLGKTNFAWSFCLFSLEFGLSTQLGRRHCENNVPNWTLYSGQRLWHGNTLLNLAKQLLSHGAYPFLKFGFVCLEISLFVAKLRKVRGFVIL